MEYVRKCKVCGKVYCYTDADLKKNKTNSISAGISAIGTIASLFGGGSMLTSAYLNNQTDKYGDRVVDYTKCPNCNSTRTYLISDESENIESENIELKNVEITDLGNNYTEYDQKVAEESNGFEDIIDKEVADGDYSKEEGAKLKALINKMINSGNMTREEANNLKPSDIFMLFIDNL